MLRPGIAVLVTTIAGWQIAVPPIQRFVDASSADEQIAKVALEQIAGGWNDSYAAMFIDMARLMRPSRRNAPTTLADSSQILDDGRSAPGPERPFSDAADLPDRGSPVRRRLVAFLEKQTGHRFGDDLTAWRDWMWKLPYYEKNTPLRIGPTCA